ncbi:MAG: acylphosphatase [bacterium]|nr:acylphosphatase [bacterium]
MIKRLRVKVFGDVQGVFFRYAAEEKARILGLAGWAKNTDDGAVEILAEGDEKRLKEFLDWCYLGPPTAKVEKTEVEWEEATGEFKDFEIR